MENCQRGRKLYVKEYGGQKIIFKVDVLCTQAIKFSGGRGGGDLGRAGIPS